MVYIWPYLKLILLDEVIQRDISMFKFRRHPFHLLGSLMEEQYIFSRILQPKLFDQVFYRKVHMNKKNLCKQ